MKCFDGLTFDLAFSYHRQRLEAHANSSRELEYHLFSCDVCYPPLHFFFYQN